MGLSPKSRQLSSRFLLQQIWPSLLERSLFDSPKPQKDNEISEWLQLQASNTYHTTPCGHRARPISGSYNSNIKVCRVSNCSKSDNSCLLNGCFSCSKNRALACRSFQSCSSSRRAPTTFQQESMAFEPVDIALTCTLKSDGYKYQPHILMTKTYQVRWELIWVRLLLLSVRHFSESPQARFV